jgi:glutathione synthase/RimK-type ligase-like ATP-grasp enzyme
MEVNAFPMLAGIEAATKINVADQIIQYAERGVGVKPKRDKIGA